MPRVGIKAPKELVRRAEEFAEERGITRDEVYAEALADYVRASAEATSKDRRTISREAWHQTSLPQIAVKIDDDLFRRADRLAKKLDKPRDLLYAEAVTLLLRGDEPLDNPLASGHHAVEGAPTGSIADDTDGQRTE